MELELNETCINIAKKHYVSNLFCDAIKTYTLCYYSVFSFDFVIFHILG